jgi:hypothetical protein
MLSAGLMATRVLGRGYSAAGLARIGAADRKVNAELSLQRGSGDTELGVAAYTHLVPANDWGNPLGLGASISALLFARDDGFYYRSSGGEFTATHRSTGGGLVLAGRLFGEYQTTAAVATQRSVANSISGTQFTPNILSRRGAYWGGAATLSYSRGLDPRGNRISGNTRIEAATGEVQFARGMTELTFTRGLSESSSLLLTGAAGSSLGALPRQRLWFLGGPYTVHAQVPGSVSGNAFWLGRGEITTGNPMFRPVAFADIGWAGARADWSHSPTAASAAGIGASMMDGLVRFDVARGFKPRARWRVDFYVEIR